MQLAACFRQLASSGLEPCPVRSSCAAEALRLPLEARLKWKPCSQFFQLAVFCRYIAWLQSSAQRASLKPVCAKDHPWCWNRV